MATTAIAMRTKDQSNTTGTTTINYVNPNATSEQLQSLASAMNALTTNEIVDVTRIDKQVLGSEIAKLPRNFKFMSGDTSDATEITSLSWATISTDPDQGTETYFKFDGEATDEQIWYRVNGDSTVLTSHVLSDVFQYSKGHMYTIKSPTEQFKEGTSITVYLPETNEYAAATATLTIVA